MTEATGMTVFNSDVTATETTEIVKEIEVIVEIDTTGIVITKRSAIETKSEDIVQDLTLVPGLLRKAVTNATIVKTKRTREDVQEAD